MSSPAVNRSKIFSRARFVPAFLIVLALGVMLLPPAHAVRRQPPQFLATMPQQSLSPQAADARPRRVMTTVTPHLTATPAPTPQPTPATVSGRPNMTPQPPRAPRQEDDDPEAPRMRTPQEEEEVEAEDVVRVETNLINLQVRVIDRNNRPINDVRKEDFRVFENGVLQTVEYFTREEVPIQYGLVIDNSGSMRAQLPKVIEAAKTIVNSNKPGDETFIVRFIDSNQIKTLQDFTSNQNELLDTLEEELYIEGGQTAVIDAVYLSAEKVATYKKGNDLDDRRRRALIVVTDGEDRTSYYKQEQLFNMLRESSVQIYFIGFVNELDKEGGFIRKSPREKAVNLVNQLAKETGGRAFFPTSVTELPQIAEEITRDLRTQFVVSYKPTDKARPGEFRPVRVTIADAPGKDKRLAITRAGYTAPRGSSGPTSPAPPPATRAPQPGSAKRP